MSRNKNRNARKNKKRHLAEMRAMESSLTTQVVAEEETMATEPEDVEVPEEGIPAIQVLTGTTMPEETAAPAEGDDTEEPTEASAEEPVEDPVEPSAEEDQGEDTTEPEQQGEDETTEPETPAPESEEPTEEPAPMPLGIGTVLHNDDAEASASAAVATMVAEQPQGIAPPIVEENPMALPPIGRMGFEEMITPQDAGVLINKLQDELISSLRSDIAMLRESHERELTAINSKHRMEMDTLNTSISELHDQHDAAMAQQSSEYQANLSDINKRNAAELARQRDELNAQIKDQKQHYEETLRKERADASARIRQAEETAAARVRQAEETAAATRDDALINKLTKENESLKRAYSVLYTLMSQIRAELEPVDPDVRMKPIFSDQMIEEVCSSIQMVKYKYDRNDIANIIDRAIWNLKNMQGSETEMANMRKAVRYALSSINQSGVK